MIFGAPNIGEAEIEAVAAVLRTGWISQGPKVEEFEAQLKRYLGCDEVVCVSSCTAALHLALRSCDLKPGDKVVVPTMTFVATVNVVLELGLEPVFADCDPDTLNIIIPDHLRTKGVKAIIPVHFAGLPCDMHRIFAAANANHWHIIEDAAHAFGAGYDGTRIGSLGNVTCFSFYPNKVMTTIEGGAIALRGKTAKLADRFRLERLHGLSKDAWKRFDSKNAGTTLMESFGYKYNMTDVQAAVGLVQLAKFPTMQAVRQKYWCTYRNALQGLPLKLAAAPHPGDTSSYYLFVIQLHDPSQRQPLREYLSARGIPTGIHYVPVHQQPFYRRYRDPNIPAHMRSFFMGDHDIPVHSAPFSMDRCPNAERIGQSCLSLPLSSAMTEADVHATTAAVKAFFNEA